METRAKAYERERLHNLATYVWKEVERSALLDAETKTRIATLMWCVTHHIDGSFTKSGPLAVVGGRG